MTFVGTKDASIDEDEAVTKLTTEMEVELRIDEDEAVPKPTTEVELRIDEDEAVPKLTTEVELKMGVGLKFRSAA